MLHIINDGPAIRNTNFWDSEHARRGLFFLSWNAGSGRLMVPDSQRNMLKEMKTAEYLILSRGPWPMGGKSEAYELLFEDHSDCPFSINIGHEQTDRLIPKSEAGREFNFSIWTRDGLYLELKGRYRVVNRIPNLKAWA